MAALIERRPAKLARPPRLAPPVRPKRLERPWLGLVLLLAASNGLSGCVSPPPPREIDLAQAVIVSTPTTLTADLGRADDRAAGKGAGGGAAVGLTTGILACTPTLAFLYLYPLCILGATGVGAGAGAAAGSAVRQAVLDDDATAVQRRAGMVAELQAPRRQETLVAELQRRLHDDFARDLPLVAAGATGGGAAAGDGAGRPWQVEVGLNLVGIEGGSRSFSVHLEAAAQVRRRADGRVLFTTVKEVKSETELDAAGWLDGQGRALRGVLDRCTEQVARNLAVDLMQPPANLPRQRSAPEQATRFASCNDVPAQWEPPSRASAKPAPPSAGEAAQPGE